MHCEALDALERLGGADVGHAVAKLEAPAVETYRADAGNGDVRLADGGFDLSGEIDLRAGKTGLAADYAKGSIVSLRLGAGELPPEAELHASLHALLRAYDVSAARALPPLRTPAVRESPDPARAWSGDSRRRGLLDAHAASE